MEQRIRSTTIVVVKKDGKVAMAGDGQVTYRDTVLKSTASKVKKVNVAGGVLIGFAGNVADAMVLRDKLVSLIHDRDNLPDAILEFMKYWRSDKIIRLLEAVILVADKESIYYLDGSGNIVQIDEQVASIGSGDGYARASALAYLENDSLSANEIAQKSLKIASKLCIYTNDRITVEEL